MASTTVSIAGPPMVPAGSRVVAIVSSGPGGLSRSPYVTVPVLVGREQGAALTELQGLGLSAQVFNDYSDSVKRGSVIAQYPSPSAGVPAGSGAVLLVSSGRAPAPSRMERLPELAGLAEAEAVAFVQAASMSPQIVREPSATVPAGIVISQVPSELSLAFEPRTRPAWWLWVAIGVALAIAGIAAFLILRPAPVVVPDITGSTQKEAAETLVAAGLELGSVEETQSASAPEGTVVSQDPPAGTKSPEGSAVDVVVVGAEPPIKVPEVRAQNQADATRELAAVGLQVSATRAFSPSVDKGLVMEQSPSAGQEVPKGTTVAIVISDGPPVSNVAVPDVIGMNKVDAEEAIKGVELRVVSADSPSDDTLGAVIEQYPGAGETVAPGTTIGVLVSMGPSTEQLIDIPDVTGLTLAEAQQVITDAGLEAAPTASTSDKPANEVVAQLPAAGESTAAGESVLLFYSAGP